MLTYDESTGQWIEDGAEVPDIDAVTTDIYNRGGLTEIPEAEKAALVRRTSGHSPSVIPNQVVDIDAMAEAQRQREEPVQYIPFKPRVVDESQFTPKIKGYGDRVILEKEPGQWVDSWGKPVTQGEADEIEADMETLRLGGPAADEVKKKGNIKIPPKPPADYDQYMEWMENARTNAQEFANRQVQAFKDRYTAVDEALMTPGQKAKYLEEQQREGSDAYKFYMGRASQQYDKKKVAEERAAKEMKKAAEQAEKDAKKEAEHIRKRQEKIEDDLRKGKITNLNNMEKEARSDFRKLTKNGMTNFTEDQKAELTRIEKNIAEIIKRREDLYGGERGKVAETATTKKLIGKKNGKPVYDLGNGKWQIGD